MNDQQPLIIFEMANNHMGSRAHGLALIDAFAEVVSPYRDRFEFAFKLQYRDLDTFLHPGHLQNSINKHIKRFLETRLSEADFLALVERMRERGFKTVCTPFDEVSVERVERHGFDYVKIASCSLGDWPLMERIGTSTLPIIASTAGADLDLIDRTVGFFTHRNRPLALMHCVGEYPTPPEHMHLDQLDLLRQRYPELPLGFSTHEAPTDTSLVRMAIAKGARLLERHVGLPTAQWPLNAYSGSPAHIAAWLAAAAEALAARGHGTSRPPPSPVEQDSLRSLRRGVWAKRPLAAGECLDRSNIVLAMPAAPGQLTAQDLGKYVQHRLRGPIAAMGPVMAADVDSSDDHQRVRALVFRVRSLLEAAHVVVPKKCNVDISHHYGLDRFEEIGCTILNVLNRSYCKKIIVVLPGQRHPEQYHHKKEETFHLLHGDLGLRLDGVETPCRAGELVTVERGVRHEFWSTGGAVLEEVSSTHYVDDSFYTDPAIAANPRRKTSLTYFFG